MFSDCETEIRTVFILSYYRLSKNIELRKLGGFTETTSGRRRKSHSQTMDREYGE